MPGGKLNLENTGGCYCGNTALRDDTGRNEMCPGMTSKQWIRGIGIMISIGKWGGFISTRMEL